MTPFDSPLLELSSAIKYFYPPSRLNRNMNTTKTYYNRNKIGRLRPYIYTDDRLLLGITDEKYISEKRKAVSDRIITNYFFHEKNKK